MENLDSIPIAQIILYLPTVLFAVAVLWGMLRGLMRGYRKSMVFFINTIIALAICIFVSASISASQVYSIVYSNVPGLGLTAESLDAYLLEFLADSEIIVSSMSTAALAAYIDMVLHLVLFAVILLLIYPLLKFILFIIYLIFFKRKIRILNEDTGSKRILGAGVGLLRGALMGFLIFSQFSTFYCIAAGGVFYNPDDYNSIIVDGEVWEYDEYYKAVKTSRSFGLGALFDTIAGENGTALDYYLLDYVAKGSYENHNGEEVTLVFREELSGFTGFAAALIDNGVAVYNSDGIEFNFEKIDDNVIRLICDSLGSTKTITDVLPTVLVDFLVTSELIDLDPKLLSELDLENDFKYIAELVTSVLQLIDLSEDMSFENIDWLDLDPELVDAIIESISQLTFLTKVALPLGSSMLNELVEGLVFDLDSIIWEDEISNLKGLYSLITSLPISEYLAGEIDLFEDILGNEEVMSTVDEILGQILDSELIYSIAIGGMEYAINNVFADSEYTDGLEIDITNYSKELLKEDVSIILSMVTTTMDLVEYFTSEEFSENFFDMDVTPIRKVLLGYSEGSTYYYGFFDLNIIECIDINTLLQNLISTSLSDSFTIPEVSDWKQEIDYLLTAVEALQSSGIDFSLLVEGDYSSLGDLDSDAIDLFKSSIINSKVLSSVIVSTLESSEMFEIPENVSWYGNNGELDCLLSAIFHMLDLDILNSLLEGEFTTVISTLTEKDVDILLRSTIIHVLISNTLVEMGDVLVIPSSAYSGDYISREEIKNLVNVIILNPNILDDYESIQIFSDENIDLISNSKILSRTIINMIETSFESSIITIPDLGESWYDENEEFKKLLLAVQGLLGSDTTIAELSSLETIELSLLFENSEVVLNSSVILISISNLIFGIEMLEVPNTVTFNCYGNLSITRAELLNLIDAIKTLGLEDFESFDFNILFDDELVYSELLNSEILAATISSLVIEYDIFYIANGMLVDGYISKSELISLLEVIRSLEIDLEVELDFTTILTNMKELLNSNILYMTISQMIQNTDILAVPNSAYASDLLYSENVIDKEELSTLFDILSSLGLTDLDNLDVNLFFDESIVYSDLMDSKILSATLSTFVIAASVDGTLVIPDDAYDSEGYIIESELIALLNALRDLGFDDIESIDITLESILSNSSIKDSINNSLIIHATISDVIMNSSNLDIVYEYYGEDVVVDNVITKEEILSLIDALLALDTDFSSVDSIGLSSILAYDDEISTLIKSSIMATIISSILIDNTQILVAAGITVESKLENLTNGEKTSIISKTNIELYIDTLNSFN